MSLRYRGGFLSATAPTTSSSSAGGVWTLKQQLQAVNGSGWPAVNPDPYWANVTLLAHGNTNGADSSNKGNTLTATATNATINTSTYKFGGGSFQNTGNNGSAPAYYWYNTSPAANSFNFGTGAFTIEFFCIVTSAPRASDGGIVCSTDRTSNVGFWIGVRGIQLGNGNTATTLFYDVAGWSSVLTNGSWHYVVVQRDGSGNWRVYLDGSLFQSGSGLTDNINTNQILVGLSYTNGEYAMNGYVDELRVTYGVARYPSSITSALAGVTVSGGVPTAQFPG